MDSLHLNSEQYSNLEQQNVAIKTTKTLLKLKNGNIETSNPNMMVYVKNLDVNVPNKERFQCINNPTIGELEAKCESKANRGRIKRARKCDPAQWQVNKKKCERILSKGPKDIDCSSCRLKCTTTFTYEQRKDINRAYWQLSYTAQKNFILENVDKQEPGRRTATQNEIKRLNTKQFYFNLGDERVRVCQKFFSATLAINKNVVTTAFKYQGPSGLFEGADRRGGHKPKYDKTPLKKVEDIKSCIASVTRGPSEEPPTLTEMHRHYRDLCAPRCEPTIICYDKHHKSLNNINSLCLNSDQQSGVEQHSNLEQQNVTLNATKIVVKLINGNIEMSNPNMIVCVPNQNVNVAKKEMFPCANNPVISELETKCESKANKGKIKGKRKRDPAQWKVNKRRFERLLSKEPKDIDCSSCRHKCTTKCTSEQRKEINQEYWRLNYTAQKNYILQNVCRQEPQRRTAAQKNCKRLDTKQFFFNLGDEKVRVCQKFFSATLAINKDVVLTAFKYQGPSGWFEGKDHRGAQHKPNRTPVKVVEDIKRHIASVTRGPSEKPLTLSEMHCHYRELCASRFCYAVSRVTYGRIYQELKVNLSNDDYTKYITEDS